MAGKLARMKRVTDLFVEGSELVIDPGDDGGEAVLVWVNKLNPFERQEAERDGTAGRARAVLALSMQGSDDFAVFQEQIERRSQEDVINGLINSRQAEFYAQSVDEIATREDWADKIAVLERGDSQLRDSGRIEDADLEMFSTINTEYMELSAELVQGYMDELRAELMEKPVEKLREEYLEVFREMKGQQGFLKEYRTTEVFFALRECEATGRAENGRWDHSACDHRQRFCDTRADVYELPEGLLNGVRATLDALNMTPREAGNSDAPASSSASSEPPSEAADSMASTPVTT